jgi:hypothetical protein
MQNSDTRVKTAKLNLFIKHRNTRLKYNAGLQFTYQEVSSLFPNGCYTKIKVKVTQVSAVPGCREDAWLLGPLVRNPPKAYTFVSCVS